MSEQKRMKKRLVLSANRFFVICFTEIRQLSFSIDEFGFQESGASVRGLFLFPSGGNLLACLLTFGSLLQCHLKP